MGWGHCGTDSNGRPIGYCHEATCDHPGCDKKIDRGLAFVCGNMHGEDEYSCEKYYCEDHMRNFVNTFQGDGITVCDECRKVYESDEDWILHPEDGEWNHISTVTDQQEPK